MVATTSSQTRDFYACSSYKNGGPGACSNGIRVRLDALEAAILDPVRRDLLSPERVEAMAREMQRYYTERAKVQDSLDPDTP